MIWEEWASEVKKCKKCELQRTIKVLGRGPIPCPIVFVGESPGENEGKQGIPFIGKAGQLLDEILGIVGWNERVYVTNIVKCHPPNNETTSNSVVQCVDWFLQELEIVQPKIVVAVGGFAITAFGISESITKSRGRWYNWKNGIEVMPIFHPSHVLHGGGSEAKRSIIKDLISVREKLWGVGMGKKVKGIKIRSKLLEEDILIGEDGTSSGVSLSDLWNNVKGGSVV